MELPIGTKVARILWDDQGTHGWYIGAVLEHLFTDNAALSGAAMIEYLDGDCEVLTVCSVVKVLLCLSSRSARKPSAALLDPSYAPSLQRECSAPPCRSVSPVGLFETASSASPPPPSFSPLGVWIPYVAVCSLDRATRRLAPSRTT